MGVSMCTACCGSHLLALDSAKCAVESTCCNTSKRSKHSRINLNSIFFVKRPCTELFLHVSEYVCSVDGCYSGLGTWH